LQNTSFDGGTFLRGNPKLDIGFLRTAATQADTFLKGRNGSAMQRASNRSNLDEINPRTGQLANSSGHCWAGNNR
jgi:hypothetical protein